MNYTIIKIILLGPLAIIFKIVILNSLKEMSFIIQKITFLGKIIIGIGLIPIVLLGPNRPITKKLF